jgi:hypothetical protein
MSAVSKSLVGYILGIVALIISIGLTGKMMHSEDGMHPTREAHCFKSLKKLTQLQYCSTPIGANGSRMLNDPRWMDTNPTFA